jgi:hypothetical protein
VHDQPVTIGEIANLLHGIRAITGNPTAEPAARAEVLARKADLLARIADQRAQEWNCEHTEQAHHSPPTPRPSPSRPARPPPLDALRSENQENNRALGSRQRPTRRIQSRAGEPVKFRRYLAHVRANMCALPNGLLLVTMRLARS